MISSASGRLPEAQLGKEHRDNLGMSGLTEGPHLCLELYIVNVSNLLASGELMSGSATPGIQNY